MKLLGSEDAPAITTTTLPGGTVGTPYHHQLQANGGGFILWELFSGALPKGLTLKQTTGEISGTPTAEGTATFTVKATNSAGSNTKELSITITKAAPTEHTVTVTTEGNGTASASHAKAAAGTTITLSATPDEGYHLKEWQVESPAGLVITNNKFTMPDTNVAIKAIFEEDAPSVEDLVDPVIRIHLSPWGGGYYAIENGENCTRTAADFFQPGKAPEGAKITAVTPPTSPSISVSVNVDSGGTLSCTKTENTTEPVFKSETYTVTITSDDYEPISAPLTVRQYLNAGFEGPIRFNDELLYGDTYTYTCRVNNPGENGVWSALIRDPDIFEIYQETTNITSEPGKSIYTVKIRAIKTGRTCIDFLYLSDTTLASSRDSDWDITGGTVSTRPLTVTAGSASITKGDALPTDLVTCTGLLDSEGRKDDRDTVLDNALSYRLLNANNEEVAADTARNTPGTYTVVPAAALKSGWDERYSLNRVNGTLTVKDKVEELFTVTVTSGGNGTASASPAKAVAGAEITLSATPDKGYHLKEWQVESPAGLVITNNKFTMPDGNVEVKAIFEEDTPPAPTEFIVTFDGNGGTPSVGSMTTTDQKLTSLPSASRSGSYSFDGWYTEKSGGTKITTDTAFSANTTVYAHWTYTGGYTPPVRPRPAEDVPAKYPGFVDAPASSYFYEAVMWAVESGVTTGVSANRFDPNGVCTRAQAVTFLWRTAGSPEPETRTMPFADAPAGSYYYDAVLWAVENGITKGTSNTTFNPNDTCTRAQIVSFLWRSEKTPVASSRNLFTDVKPGAYYLDAVLWAVESGITKGTTAMKFSPDADCTRAQIVTFLWRCKK